MAMKQPKRKERGIHDLLIEDKYDIDRVVESSEGLGKIVKKYEGKVQYCEIANFTVIPGRLVPKAKPRKLDRDYFKDKSFVIYVRNDND